jgi:hypothetical protein
MVDTTKTTTSMLPWLVDFQLCAGSSYRVVKFIVKVRLIEKSVKSQVGKVYDNQKRMVGSTLRMESITCPSTPKVDLGALSAAFRAAMDV